LSDILVYLDKPVRTDAAEELIEGPEARPRHNEAAEALRGTTIGGLTDDGYGSRSICG
jgi:hypothetical protein